MAAQTAIATSLNARCEGMSGIAAIIAEQTLGRGL